MEDSEINNFKRIEEAIGYIRKNFKMQPNLEELSDQLNLSPFHFQRLFSDWAGVSPKKFLQYTTLSYAKEKLKQKESNLLDTAYDVGLSGSSRLYDLFVNIEGMTPGEFKNGGEDLSIDYSYSESPFGKLFCASTEKGICHLTFTNNEVDSLKELKLIFPNANFKPHRGSLQKDALEFFSNKGIHNKKIRLHLKGTSFQIKVWEALLRIPYGGLTTYGSLAQTIKQPNAARAVGTAVGSNPVAYLIPCHRVIQSSGEFGQYHWGSERKVAMIAWEASQLRED